jgi:Rrf2 family transcriptional repressor of oqxAB
MGYKISTNLGWFRVAVQGLVILAETGEACPSTVIARDLKAHAFFLRRVMAQLVHAHIVTAREGRDGGYQLARPADRITLAEVYQAINLAGQPEEETTPDQNANTHVQEALDEVATEVEQALLMVLNRHTIASIIEHSTASHRLA